MRLVLLLLLFLVFPPAAQAVPISQHFGPQPDTDVPARVEGAASKLLKQYEAELAGRLKRKPDDPYLSHRLATVLYHQGRVEEAVRAWRRAASQEPNLASAEFMSDIQEVFSLLAKGSGREAQEKLAAAEKRYAKDPHFHLARGEQAVRSGNLEQAEKSYLRARDLGPKLYVTSLNLGRFYEFRMQHDMATKHFVKATELAPRRAECWTYLGNHQFQRGDWDAALKSYRRVRELDADEPLPEIQLAKLCVGVRDYLGARYWYGKALKNAPPNANAIRVALSDVQFRLGLLPEARKEIETVLKTEELAPLLVALATIEEAEKNMQAAEKYYRRALTKKPGDIISSNNLAMLLVRANKSGREALSLAESARKAMPQNPQILGTYACALYQADKHAEARKILPQAMRLNPGDPWVRYFLGKTLLKEKRSEEARLHLEGVLVLDPSFPHKEEIRTLIKGS
jgi:tetratricopeptide (TPR) repeat protein